MADLHQNAPEGTPSGNQAAPGEGTALPAESTAPQGAKVFRFQQRVRDALESVPSGAEASSYFGIDGGVPKLSPLEAALAEQVLRGLQGVSAGDIDLLSILRTIQKCNQASTIDPDILRALRQPPSRGST